MSAEFVLESVAEPVAAPLLAERQPLYREVPIFFADRAGVSPQAVHKKYAQAIGRTEGPLT